MGALWEKEHQVKITPQGEAEEGLPTPEAAGSELGTVGKAVGEGQAAAAGKTTQPRLCLLPLIPLAGLRPAAFHPGTRIGKFAHT